MNGGGDWRDCSREWTHIFDRVGVPVANTYESPWILNCARGEYGRFNSFLLSSSTFLRDG